MSKYIIWVDDNLPSLLMETMMRIVRTFNPNLEIIICSSDGPGNQINDYQRGTETILSFKRALNNIPHDQVAAFFIDIHIPANEQMDKLGAGTKGIIFDPMDAGYQLAENIIRQRNDGVIFDQEPYPNFKQKPFSNTPILFVSASDLVVSPSFSWVKDCAFTHHITKDMVESGVPNFLNSHGFGL